MALILQKAWETYWVVFDDIVDQRTKSWPFVAKPIQGLGLLGLYLMFVLKWGPQWMKNRQPFNLDKLLIVYNAFQVIACAYVFIKAITLAWGWKYKWICEPVDTSNSEEAMEIATMVYFYYILKLLDLLDTVFFVLRKKSNQISFLHIYHHTGMVMLIWGAITYLPGGHGTLVGVINSFVHTVMYSYYLLTVASPTIKNALWVKKYVTQIQIIQFFWCVMHMGVIVFKTDCQYPRWTAAMFLPQNLFMLILFIDFYIKTYIRKPQKKPLQHSNGIYNSNEIINNDINIVKNNNGVTDKCEINNNNNVNSNINDDKNNNKLPCANGKGTMKFHDKQK